MSSSFCHLTYPWKNQTRLKAGVSYPLPYDIRVGPVLQNLPGYAINTSYVATNAAIAPSLGRNLGQCGTTAVCNGTVVISSLTPPYTVFTERITQVDLRFSKIFRIQKVRVQGNLDLYNAFNGNTVTQVNTRYGGSWLQPTVIQDGRLVKFGAHFEF